MIGLSLTLFVLGLLLFLLGTYTRRRWASFAACAYETAGLIVDQKSQTFYTGRSVATSKNFVVRFVTNVGQTHEFQIGNLPGLKVGDEVQVLYDPDNPARVALATIPGGMVSLSNVLIGISVFLLVASVILLTLARI